MPTTTSTFCINQGLPIARDAGSNPSRSSCLLSLLSFLPYGRQATSLLIIPSIPSSPLSTLMPGRVCRSRRSDLNLVTDRFSSSEAFELLTQDINVMAPVIQAGTEYSWIEGYRLFLSFKFDSLSNPSSTTLSIS